MRNIVTMINDIPVIDTRDMAEGFEMQHRSIMRLIDIHKASIKRFGKVRFQITPTESGQNQRHCKLNETQATFVGTLMNNKGRAIEFKIQLVEEFEKMKNYIKNQQIIRSIGVETRKSLTDAVQESGEQERMHGHGFSSYTLMVYKLLGIKDEYRAWKKTANKGDDFRLTLDPDLRKRVGTAESMVKSLLDLGNEYKEIQETIEPLFKKKEIG